MNQDLPSNEILSWFVSELSKGRILTSEVGEEFAMFAYPDRTTEIRMRPKNSDYWSCIAFVSSVVIASQNAYRDARNHSPHRGFY